MSPPAHLPSADLQEGEELPEAARVPLSSLTFECRRDELAFMIYIGKAAQTLALRLVSVLAVLWGTGTSLVIFWLFTATSANTRVRYLVVVAFQLAALAKLACVGQKVSSPSWQAVLHEEVMVSSMLWQTACTIPCVLLLKPGHMGFASAVDSMTSLGLWGAFVYVRLDTFLKFHAVLALCFLGLEADAWLRPGSVMTTGQVASDTLRYLALGLVLPLLISVSLEARMRQTFVLRCQRPGMQLGSFWEQVLAIMASMSVRLSRQLSTLGRLFAVKRDAANGGMRNRNQ
ncbi:hypothetical protein WJX72_001981 [[Myrmecia] bisecta]|uniref:Uncharacterized protein n=1 Tax=[Myrmecia] bisecta TaxID=41462 RepID=A0AAW1PXR5_9CHLO